jgi:hypothetical protein
VDGGLATFVLEPAFVLSLFVGAFHTCIYIFVRGNLGWHIPVLLVGGVMGALIGQAIGSRVGDVLQIGDYSVVWASVVAWIGIGMAIVVSAIARNEPAGVEEPGEIRPRRD